MRRLQSVLFVAIALGAVALGQQPGGNFLGMSIANQIQNMQQLLGPGPNIVIPEVGSMPGGGNCTIKVTVRDANNASRYYTATYPLIYDCKDIDVNISGSPIVVKVTIKMKEKGGSISEDLQNLGDFLKFIHGGFTFNATIQPPVAAEPRAATPTIPVVRDLPLAPPLSAGANLYGVNGCDPGVSVPLFRVNHGANTVTRLDGCSWKVTATIPVASRPLQGELTPDGKTLLVTSYDNAVTFIDTATNKVAGTLQTPNAYPAGIAISRDGAIAWVTSFIDDVPSVLVIDIANRTVLKTIPLPGAYPNSIFLSPDTTLAYVLYPLTNEVSMIDTLTSTVAATINLSGPAGMTFNRTGTRAYISSWNVPGSIYVMDTATFRVIDSISTGGSPGNVVMTADGRFLVVEDYYSTKFWTINLATREVSEADAGIESAGLVTLP